jgi:integrase
MPRLPSSLWENRSLSGGKLRIRFEFKDPRTGRRVKRSDEDEARAELRKAWKQFHERYIEVGGLWRTMVELLHCSLRSAQWSVIELLCFLQIILPKVVALRDLSKATSIIVGTLDGATNRPRSTLLVADAIASFLRARAERGCGAEHLADLAQRLGLFARQFPITTADITPALLTDFLRALDVTPRTRLNYRRALENFTNWLRGEKLLEKDFTMVDVPVPILPEKPIPIFHPDEMRWLLAHAPASVLPVLLLGGFAGLRTSEVRILRWTDISFARGRIRVPKGKTGARNVPLLANLRAWLEPLKTDGPVLTIVESSIDAGYRRAVARANRELERRGDRLRLAWKANALRHSFVSYRVAATKDLAKVSLECGHSVATLRKHYLELVDDDEAAAWFALRPGRASNTEQLSLFSDAETTPQRLPTPALRL